MQPISSFGHRTNLHRWFCQLRFFQYLFVSQLQANSSSKHIALNPGLNFFKNGFTMSSFDSQHVKGGISQASVYISTSDRKKKALCTARENWLKSTYSPIRKVISTHLDRFRQNLCVEMSISQWVLRGGKPEVIFSWSKREQTLFICLRPRLPHQFFSRGSERKLSLSVCLHPGTKEPSKVQHCGPTMQVVLACLD